MALKAEKTGSKFDRPEPLDVGSYPARLVQVISLGLQKQRPYKGQEKTPKYEIYTTYELVDEFLKDEDGNEIEDKPRWLSESFALLPLDSDLANSTKRYLSLDPLMEHDGDWAALVGTPCVVTVVQNKSKKDDNVIYNNIDGVSAMRAKEAAKLPELVNPPKIFDIDEPDMEIFFSLPEWLQDRIKDNLEYDGSALEKLIEEHKDSDGGEDKEKPKGRKKAAQKAPEVDEDDEDGDW